MSYADASAYWKARYEPHLRILFDVLEWSGSLLRAVWLGQAIYWATHSADSEGWVDKTVQDFEDFTTLGKTCQQRVKTWLKKEGLLETKNKGLPRRALWRLNLPELLTRVKNLPTSTPARGVQEEPLAAYIPISEGIEEEGSTHPSGGSLFELETDPEPKKPKAKSYTQSFEAFWVPAREAWLAASKVPGNKREAFRAWERIVAGDRPGIDAATSWLDGYRRTEAAGIFPGGVPHLCRWLKNDRYADEWPEAKAPEADLDEWNRGAAERAAETRRMLRDQRGE